MMPVNAMNQINTRLARGLNLDIRPDLSAPCETREWHEHHGDGPATLRISVYVPCCNDGWSVLSCRACYIKARSSRRSWVCAGCKTVYASISETFVCAT